MVRIEVLDSGSLLKALGYDFAVSVEGGSEPPATLLKFSDVAPELAALWIGGCHLYRHQLEALEALGQGRCVVLKSGTGSGKTEAWFLHFYKEFRRWGSYRALALYPTLALANDQIKRLSAYCEAVGAKILQLDAPRRDELVKKLGSSGVRREVAGAHLLITNPAFLLNDVKKFLLRPSSSLLHPFLTRVNLIVVDEFDFYGPREVALLLAMLEVVVKVSETKPQVAILTATLANPEEVCSFLEAVTGRECAIVDGVPFRVENRLYVVLGKDLRAVWETVRGYRGLVESRGIGDEAVLKALEDFEYFRKSAYKVLQYLSALGLKVPSPSVDALELLTHYAKDSGVTLVFTRSISRAEEVAKALRERVGNAAAAHHHLVPKQLRERIEEGARRGEVKVIVSPRTLVQGIDIGTVVRVVHLGLPESVREFLQREGRKGRRREIQFTESIVIPSTRWDWELLSKGLEALERWLSLPLEKSVVNPRNKYVRLFTGLAKLLSPWFKGPLTAEELEVLGDVGIVGPDGSVNEARARKVWEGLNFYEFGPPYGIRRYLEGEGGKLIPLEPIGRCDLVERFQVGCIDPTQDAIVTQVLHGRSPRLVRAVIERPLKAFRLSEHDAIAEAYEEYRYIKLTWGEEPSLLRDIARGKLHSYAVAVVYPPRRGFGELKKVPNRVMWYLASERPRIIKVGGRYLVTYDRKVIYVPVETFGEYRDFTYGTILEVDEREDPSVLRLGLAYLMVVLRRELGLPLGVILYGVERVGEKKFIELHEPEAAGLLEGLEWGAARRAVEAHTPDDLDLVLLSQLDEIAFSDLVSLGIGLEEVKAAALRALDYLELQNKVRVVLGGRAVSVPKPSRALRLLSLDAVVLGLEEEPLPKVLAAVAVFDGEEVRFAAAPYVKYPFAPPPMELRDLETSVEDLVYYQEFGIVVYDVEAAVRELSRANLRRLVELVRERASSVRDLALRLGLERPSVALLVEGLREQGVEVEVADVAELHRRLTEARESGDFSAFVDKASGLLRDFLERRVRGLYVVNLALRSLIGASDSR